MPILPIDTGRYATPEMMKIFDAENKLQKMLDVEAALAWAHAQVGDIPMKNAKRIMRKASTKYVTGKKVEKVEREIKHDVMAVVRVLSQVSGPSGAYVHLGATSNDITDTALALQLRSAINLIERRLNELEKVLMLQAERYKDTVMIGRTHGQHAIPVTLGFKFAVWMREIARHNARLRQCRDRVLVGKMSGAVGTQAGFGVHALEIQDLVMEKLRLKPSDITTQIVQRDHHAELIFVLVNIASSLGKFALEIRELQRPEIGELAEPFEVAKQVGSSTMPHKRNPEISERICGLAKIMRSLVQPALENVSTWHERDLTQSSAERFIIPEAFIILDYMAVNMTTIIQNIYVNKRKMMRNLNLTQGRSMSESVMLTLARKGVSRQEAHELIRKLAMKSELEHIPFREVLVKDPIVTKYLKPSEIYAALEPNSYLGTTVKQIESAIKKTQMERSARKIFD